MKTHTIQYNGKTWEVEALEHDILLVNIKDHDEALIIENGVQELRLEAMQNCPRTITAYDDQGYLEHDDDLLRDYFSDRLLDFAAENVHRAIKSDEI